MTFLELRKQFEAVEEDWINRIKAQSYKDLEIKWRSKPELHRKGIAWMIEFMEIHVYKALVFTLEDKDREWKKPLFYAISQHETLHLIKARIKEIKTFFEQNKSRSLHPDIYIEELSTPIYPHILFNRLPQASREKIMKEAKKELDNDKIYDCILDEMDEFHELHEITIEFMYLKTLFEKLQNEYIEVKKIYQSTSSLTVKNKYPEIFTSKNSNLLFNYTLNEWKKKENIGPAILTKLWKHFKDEKRIHEEAKPLHYKNFLKTEHNTPLRKFDDRTEPSSLEREIFKEMEDDFQKEFNIIN